MRLRDVLKLAGGEMLDVEKALKAFEARFPDSAAEIDPILALLDLPVSPENLAALGALIPGELLNIAHGKIEPRRHSGDVI